jgi:hypothetical protein
VSTGTVVAIIVVVVVVIAVVAAVALTTARRRRLQERFGPEYDRAVGQHDSRLKAESELAARERRVRSLEIRPLDPAARARYAERWALVQEQFVNTPGQTVVEAHALVIQVMDDRGYPTDDPQQITADLSVGHATTLDHYRTASAVADKARSDAASTEELRQAMLHYRALFVDLLGTADGEADSGARGSGTATRPAAGAHRRGPNAGPGDDQPAADAEAGPQRAGAALSEAGLGTESGRLAAGAGAVGAETGTQAGRPVPDPDRSRPAADTQAGRPVVDPGSARPAAGTQDSPAADPGRTAAGSTQEPAFSDAEAARSAPGAGGPGASGAGTGNRAAGDNGAPFLTDGGQAGASAAGVPAHDRRAADEDGAADGGRGTTGPPPALP